jgi:hypothetical protein
VALGLADSAKQQIAEAEDMIQRAIAMRESAELLLDYSEELLKVAAERSDAGTVPEDPDDVAW